MIMNARGILVTGLVASAAGILTQSLSGVDMPAVPPALVLLVVAAVAVILTANRWIALLGALVGLSEVVGVIASGAVDGLAAFGEPGVAAGAWLRLGGAGVAVAAGIAGARRRAPSR